MAKKKKAKRKPPKRKAAKGGSSSKKTKGYGATTKGSGFSKSRRRGGR
tara:strand:+ start:957 stop:1100 length:144 start_codon:yes stop_codon:yes gene_type:complete